MTTTRRPTFTHEELMALADAMTQFCENHDGDEPPAGAVTALEKLDEYVAEAAQ